jgi:hypothetical protein
MFVIGKFFQAHNATIHSTITRKKKEISRTGHDCTIREDPTCVTGMPLLVTILRLGQWQHSSSFHPPCRSGGVLGTTRV